MIKFIGNDLLTGHSSLLLTAGNVVTAVQPMLSSLLRHRVQSRTRAFCSLLSGDLHPSASSPSSIDSIFDYVKNDQLKDIPLENIRNFSVIAHVDHGKSTLSDCILQLTGNINDKDRRRGQVLDTLKVERDRGITVKAQTASMIYKDKRFGNEINYLINLIDTPGHIDFSYEVTRSLASCQGALLLVDSSQSIQAQTLANHGKAKTLGLSIIPVVTKIDLPNALPDETALLMSTTFNIDPDCVIHTSAKKGIGIIQVLEAVVDHLPSPQKISKASNGSFYGRIVDSWFDEHRGVICLVQVIGGQLNENQRITTFASIREAKDIDSRNDFSVQEIGLLTPNPLRTSMIKTGQVGYVICGMRSTRQARIGDTMYIPAEWNKTADEIVPLEGYASAKPMLFASVFPADPNDLDLLFSSVDRLCLNDSSISVVRDQSASLGAGLRCGFLGFLHMEVFNQRLNDEFNCQTVMTSPSVPYMLIYEDGGSEIISNTSSWPGQSRIGFEIHEPMVLITLITPKEYYGNMMDIIKDRRGLEVEVTYLDDGQVLITSIIPWQEVVCDMHDSVKHSSSGYASLNYEEAGYKKADLVKVEIVVNNESCDALSFIGHSSKAIVSGRKLAIKLKEVLQRQQFEIIIQAKIGAKVLARERIAPYRKDVLTKGGKTVGGGDITRKKKLLEKQKEGKKRSRNFGKVEISQEAFFSVLQR